MRFCVLRLSKGHILLLAVVLLAFVLTVQTVNPFSAVPAAATAADSGGFIKWAEFNIPASALKKAMAYDIKAHEAGQRLDWVELLALTGTQYYGNWSRYKARDMDEIAVKMLAGDGLEELRNNKYYPYYSEVYHAVLKEFVGEYSIEAPDPQDKSKTVILQKYGLKAFYPIAAGYGISESDDFGNRRSYGYTRAHLGHDMMGSVGTPIVAVEGGIVEELGWNQYGGWRVGIRSLDSKRYYFYGHLRKGHPFNPQVKKGDLVSAGDVIGYMGMTGYSRTEDVNGMKVPHLHFGMQLIFDESQKEALAEIWIDVYPIVQLLQSNKSVVVRDDETGDYYRKYDFVSDYM